MDDQQSWEKIEAVHRRLDALLLPQGFVRSERDLSIDGKRLNEWVRKSSWRQDRFTSTVPRREPGRLVLSVDTSVCPDTERCIEIDGATVNWLAGRDKLLELKGFDRLRAVANEDFLLERVMDDVTRALGWLSGFSTPVKCLDRMRSPERNGVRVGTPIHRELMTFLAQLEAESERSTEVLDLVIRGYTTADLSEGIAPERLAAVLCRLLEVDDLSVIAGEGGAGTKQHRWSMLDRAERSRLHARGGVQLRTLEGNQALGSISWRKIPREERNSYLRDFGHRQNSVSISLGRARLADPAFRERVLATCRELAGAFELNYLAAYNPDATPLLLPTEAELGLGLPGVYWVNLFGRPFVELLGERRLLEMSGVTVERLPGGQIMVVGPESLLDPVAAETVVRPLRASIGEEFFARMPDKSTWDGVKSVGDLLRQTSGEGQLKSNRAQLTPKFDYRALFGDD